MPDVMVQIGQQQLLLGPFRFDAWKDDEIIYNRSEALLGLFLD